MKTVSGGGNLKAKIDLTVSSKSKQRPSWNEYFFNITKVVAERSTCLRRQIASIAVKDNRILVTGYNGAPSGVKHCIDRGGCMRTELGIPSGEHAELCFSIHSEENLIVQAALQGIILKNCTIYCTNQPCIMCIRKIISLKPKQLLYLDGYPDENSYNLMKEVAFLQRINIGKYKEVYVWDFFKLGDKSK